MAGAVAARLRDLLRFRGRIGPLAYWRLSALLAIITAVTLAAGYSAVIAIGPLGGVLLTPLLGVLVGSAGIFVRRLHDRNKSAWWALLFVGAPLLGSGWIAETDPSGSQGVTLLVALIGLVLQVWGFVELGFLRGTPGPNRYGFDPRHPPGEMFV